MNEFNNSPDVIVRDGRPYAKLEYFEANFPSETYTKLFHHIAQGLAGLLPLIENGIRYYSLKAVCEVLGFGTQDSQAIIEVVASSDLIASIAADLTPP